MDYVWDLLITKLGGIEKIPFISVFLSRILLFSLSDVTTSHFGEEHIHTWQLVSQNRIEVSTSKGRRLFWIPLTHIRTFIEVGFSDIYFHWKFLQIFMRENECKTNFCQWTRGIFSKGTKFEFNLHFSPKTYSFSPSFTGFKKVGLGFSTKRENDPLFLSETVDYK